MKEIKPELSVMRISLFSFRRLMQMKRILYACGKDMADRYNLHHWDNSHFKTLLIACLSALRNRIFLVYSDSTPIATFQTRRAGDCLYFYKLATLPSFFCRGTGTYCLNEIERLGLASGCKSIRCEVYDRSTQTIGFYEHRGYSIVGEKRTLKYTELILEKKIDL